MKWHLRLTALFRKAARGRSRPKRNPLLLEALESRLAPAVSVLTYDGGAAGTGVNAAETGLTPANVNTASFGQRFVASVDGQVYAQPLVVPGLSFGALGTHDAVFVATEHDSVYALDA